MTLRDKTATSDLLHGRWSDKTGYAYIRLNGDGYEGERQRLHQPVDIMEHKDGLWLPVVTDEQPEIRCYQTGLGALKDIILDHPGGVGTTIYRVGVRQRTYRDRKGEKKQGWEFTITDKIDMAQRSLPPASQGPTQGPGGPPTGGSPNSQSLSQGCTPPPSAGPVEAPAAGKQATPAMPLPAAESAGNRATEAPMCPVCGQKAASFKGMWVHCGREVGL